MANKTLFALRKASPYTAVITREQYLFFETRITAKLVCQGLSHEEITKSIIKDNLFQFPTEKSSQRMVKTCLQRLDALNSDVLVHAIAEQPSNISKQICLYAMMKQYRLVWDFMITVIGQKYKNLETSFSKKDLNIFMIQLQEQDDGVATWSDTTVTKVKQVLVRLLIENGYLDNPSSDHLNPVLIASILEHAIREAGDEVALAAFNCLE